MDASIQKIELYGHALETPQSKLDTNLVRQAFSAIALTWSRKINAGFYDLFSDLDSLYEGGDELADEIRTQAIGQSIKLTVAHGMFAQMHQTDQDFGQPTGNPRQQRPADFLDIRLSHFTWWKAGRIRPGGGVATGSWAG
ncbi:hypothetical protein [Pseudomonas sp. Kh13]|uniref:hypothetical protein n=1 Tax=Pseudomonas sp. Kh13 TaxID=2093744 RepID=UPI001184648C|nr:hypothetical protein [Pseudomonas sp. Kh13]